jgi:hypothetical protein
MSEYEYHGSGPQLPDESWHQALGENTVQSLAGHLARQSRQGLRSGYYDQAEGEPGDDLEPGHDATQDYRAHPDGDELEPGDVDFGEAARQNPHTDYDYKSQAPRRTWTMTSRTPQSPRIRRGPGGPTRP